MEFLQKYSDAMGLSSDIVILIVMAALLYLVIGLVLGLRRAGKKIGETVQLSREEKLIPEKTALIQAGNASPVSPAGIVRRELKLENSALFSFPEFRRRTDQILSSAADYYRKLLPFFTLDGEEFRRFEPETRVIPDFEELFRFWGSGYRDGRLAALMIFYACARKIPDWQAVVFKLLAYYDIPESDRGLITFYFQDLLGEQLPVSHLNESRLQDAVRQTPLLFSLRMQNPRRISRKEFRTHVRGILFDNTTFRTELSLVQAFSHSLRRHGSPLLKSYITGRHSPHLSAEWTEDFIAQTFRSGRLNKLLQLKMENGPFTLLNQPSADADKNPHFDALRQFLALRPFGNFVWYHYLHECRKDHPLLKEIQLSWPPEKFRIGGSTPHSPWLNSIMFLHDIRRGDWERALQARSGMGIHARKPVNLFYHARALEKTGHHQEAVEILEKLLHDQPLNLMFLNETAIYHFRYRNYPRAEAIFRVMKELYPEHPATIHNEALFYEYKARREISERWEKFRNLTSKEEETSSVS